MSNDLAKQYLMRALIVKRSRLKAIEEKAGQGVCILEGCVGPIYSRGLCQRHYNAFNHEQRTLESDELRLAFEERNIVDGKILPRGEQRRHNRQSPFSQVG